MTGWREFRLDELGEILNSHRVPLSNLIRAKRQGKYPYYGASGIVDYIDDYIFDGEHLLISEDGENLVSRSTPIAFIADGQFWVNNHAHIFKGHAPYMNCLVKHYILASDLNEYITGAAQPKLSKAALLSIPFFLPINETEQKAIAAVLSSLDDKIDLLHRQNATLEAMAEALFHQWFVVEAKEEWKRMPLSNIAVFLNGLACQKYKPTNNIEKLPVLKIRELNNGISADSDWATSSIPNEYIIESGDVIFSWSGSLLVKIWHGERCVLNQHLFKVTSTNYPKWFYYFWCKHHLCEFISISESHATTMGHIKRGDLDAAEVIAPSSQELKKMSEEMEPLLSKIIHNQTQIRTLEKLRDTLLPKLMSGEVRVDY